MHSTSSTRRKRLKQIAVYFDTPNFRGIAIMVVGTLLAATAFVLSLTPTRYNLVAGMVPNATIAATRDVVDEVTTDHNRRLAASNITPTYRYQDGVTEQVLSKMDEVYLQLSAVRQYAQNLPDYSATRRYSEDEIIYAQDMLSLLELRDYQLVTLMNSAQEQVDELLTSLKAAVRNTMQGHVTQGQESTAINSILQVVGFRTSVSLLQNVAQPVLRAVILPNMIIDEVQTTQAREAAMHAVEPAVYKQGQNIVVKGEGRVTINQIAMLSELGLLSRSNIDYNLYIGSALTALIALSISGIWLVRALPGYLQNHRKLMVLYVVILGVILFTFAAKALQIPFLAPTILGAMLLTLLLGYFPALISHIALSLLTSLIIGGAYGASLTDVITSLGATLLAGSAAALVLSRRSLRAMILPAGGTAVLLCFVSYWAMSALLSRPGDLWQQSLIVSGGALLSTVLCLALQPLLETVFNLPTNNRLMELSNPNHPLLRRLLMEAPGTYHHSILIANMAETAAEAVGANPLLARVGGYYHDIGKLKRPLYFKENQIGQSNLHDSTDPAVSAAIITSHVRDGLTLARQYRLPLEVQHIVAHHHGNSKVTYFYTKAMETSVQIDEEVFRYEGSPPSSAETAIVMLCDTIEAAVRSLNNPSVEEISAFIWRLIRGKLDDGQLDNAPLTLQSLSTIRDVCTSVVYGIFHERIEYPTAEKRGPLQRMRTVPSSLAYQREKDKP